MSSVEKVRNVLSFIKAGTDGLASAIKSLQHSEKKNIFRDMKAGDFLAAVKMNEIVDDHEEKKAKKNVKETVITVLIVIAVIAVIAAIVYAIYKYFSPDYLDDYEDDMEEDYEDDFFEDEDDDVR